MVWPDVLRDFVPVRTCEDQVQVLGKGSTSEVQKWRRKNVPGVEFVAIKFITAYDEHESKQLITKEAVALRLLGDESAFVIKSGGQTVIDKSYNPPRYGLVLEYFDGEALSDLVFPRQDSVLAQYDSEATFLPLFKKIMQGVQHCHERDVVHRDLKLQDIIVGCQNSRPEQTLKIIDFGRSKEIPEPTGLTGTRTGTLEYCAPEVLSGCGMYDGKKADVWSCGIILYTVLCGQLPFVFRGVSPREALENLRSGDFPRGGKFLELTHEISDLITRMLAVDSGSRPSAEDVVRYIERVLRHDEFLEPPQGIYPGANLDDEQIVAFIGDRLFSSIE